MSKSKKFPPQVRDCTVRMLQDHGGKYPTLWAAMESFTPKIGRAPQTLNE
ncbi:MAG: hypothetical protein LWW96_19290 [Acidovorax sp.]|nr:hypothetical protein [Acidovorax sp.]MCE1194295.1 hypothetical protein [Acidovorax sp.]